MVHPRVWKAAVLNLLHGRFGNSSPGSMAAEFSRRGWLVAHFRGLEHNEDSLTEEAGLPPGGPQQAIEIFLRHLARKEIAADEGGRWGQVPDRLVLIVDPIANQRPT